MTKLLNIILICVLFFTFSCKGEKDLSIDELKTEIPNQLIVTTDAYKDVEVLKESSLFKVFSTPVLQGDLWLVELMKQFKLDLPSPNTTKSESTENIIGKFYGTYNWDSTLNKWNFISGGSNIVVNLPNESNENISMVISDIAFITFGTSTAGISLPKKMKAAMLKDNNELASVVFTLDFDLIKASINSINIKINIAPIAYSFTFSMKDDNVIVLQDLFTTNNLSVERTFELETAENILLMSAPDGKLDIVRIDGSIKSSNVEIKVVATSQSLSEGEQLENQKPQLIFYFKDQKVGDIKITENASGDPVATLVYSDGSVLVGHASVSGRNPIVSGNP